LQDYSKVYGVQATSKNGVNPDLRGQG